MSNPVDLTIKVSSDVTDAISGFDTVASSAKQMGDDVKSGAATASSSLDGIAGSADDVAGKTGIMTGALGALAGGLAAVGLEEYAGALEGAAIMTDVVSGASDLFKLALESTAIQSGIATAASIAQKGAMVISAGATAVMTGAQAALNAVMALNPIMLVVIAIGLLIAGLVIAYNKSETFRSILSKVGDVIGKVVGWVGDLAGDIGSFVGDLAGWGLDILGHFKDMFKPVDTVIGWVGDLGDDISGFVGDIGRWATDAASDFARMFQPIETAIGWVNDLIAKISSINFPDAPSWFPGRQMSTGLPTSPFPTGTAVPTTVINVTVTGAFDPDATALQIETMLDRYARRTQRR